MPINYSKYPSNWFSEVRPSVLKRADGKCECCGIRNYSVGYRDTQGKFIGACGNVMFDLAGTGLHHPSLNNLTHKEAREIADALNEEGEEKYIVIVLTIAHLDNDITNNSLENLKAMCQRCHLVYDAKYHAENARNTRQLKKQQLPIIF